MSGQWKPGDVATINGYRVFFTRRPGDDPEWCYDDGGHGDIPKEPRPLLVIDPEAAETAARLVGEFYGFDSATTNGSLVIQMQAALRSLLPRPEPDEPTGLGAVVRDGKGREFIRVSDPSFTWAWRLGASSIEYRWSGIPRPLTVLSEGVAP